MKIEINSRQTKSFYDLIEKNSEFLIKSIEAVEEYSEKKKIPQSVFRTHNGTFAKNRIRSTKKNKK